MTIADAERKTWLVVVCLSLTPGELRRARSHLEKGKRILCGLRFHDERPLFVADAFDLAVLACVDNLPTMADPTFQEDDAGNVFRTLTKLNQASGAIGYRYAALMADATETEVVEAMKKASRLLGVEA